MCGAAHWQPQKPTSNEGLSPRVWGSPADAIVSAALIRSIPTCVGQPLPADLNVGNQRVYPHVCGAAQPQKRLDRSYQGLSPRVWGSQSTVLTAGILKRSIPTCVGQPLKYPHAEILPKVYPHVCGAAYLLAV